MRNLDNLDTRILSLAKFQRFEDILSSLAPAEGAIASLVEAFDKGNVEARYFISESKVDVGVCPRMRSSEEKGTAVKWP